MDARYGELTVSQVNEYLGMLVSSDPLLSSVCVKGEISNFKYYASSGHLYFTLTDETGALKAVMFRSQAASLRFSPKDGMRVKAYGRIGIYSQGGSYQLYVSVMIEDGEGKKAKDLEALRKKLYAEGLFDEDKKRPLPKFPKVIGVITSTKGAALHDIINVTGRRYPSAKLLICPSSVQGDSAPSELCDAVRFFIKRGDIDVLIIGRGGGSGEDLSAFNDEGLVRLLSVCPFPTVSAVGHESDFSLTDYVCDKRAPTPSAAAEIVTPDRMVLEGDLLSILDNLKSRIHSVCDNAEMRLLGAERTVRAASPDRLLFEKRRELSSLEKSIRSAMNGKITGSSDCLVSKAEKLKALDPLGVLMRGYSIVRGDDGYVSSVEKISSGSSVEVTLSDGSFTADVKKIIKMQGHNS